jgi:hypothetical protein
MLLARHPHIVAAPHLRLFFALSHLQTWWQKNCGALFSRFGVDFGATRRGEAAPGAERLLTRDEFLGLCRAFAAPVLEKVASMKPGARMVVSQTPEDLKYADLLLGVFADARIVHVIRDPRSVFASQRSAAADWAQGFPASRVERARAWATDVADGLRFSELTPRYQEVRYEKLLEDGAGELRRLLEWLEVPIEAGFCESAVDACSLEKVKAAQKTAPSSFFRKGSSSGWREELSRRELRLVEQCAGSLMDRLGYERALPREARPLIEIALHDLRKRFMGRARGLGRRLAKRWGAAS